MKRLVLWVCAVWISSSLTAQTKSISIATDKTVSLIFPFPIRHVDRGTRDVLVQQVKEADNILLVKAAVRDFSSTNLSVVTSDGSLYSFSIDYQANPLTWVFSLPVQQTTTVESYARSVLDNPRTLHGIHTCHWQVVAGIIGIYIKDDVIYYQLQLANTSSLNYDIDFIRFYIRDKKKVRRTASQENEITPLYVAGNTHQVRSNTKNTLVVALPKFTIPDAKFLAIEMNEKNGGRHLQLRIGNKKIIRAIPLPDFN